MCAHTLLNKNCCDLSRQKKILLFGSAKKLNSTFQGFSDMIINHPLPFATGMACPFVKDDLF
jgi:hypothetical protein